MANAFTRIDGKDYPKAECIRNSKTGKMEHVGKPKAKAAAKEAGKGDDEKREDEAAEKKAAKK